MATDPIPAELAALLEPMRTRIAEQVGLASLVTTAFYAGRGEPVPVVDLDAWCLRRPDEPAASPTPSPNGHERDATALLGATLTDMPAGPAP